MSEQSIRATFNGESTVLKINFTWKLRCEASMATEIGPMVAEAAWRADSLFEGMST